MSDLKLALIYLRSRLLVTILTVVSVALGLALATIVLILARETQNTLRQETDRWDLVVGAKGSPLQLVLNGLYFLDQPTGNIPGELWHAMEDDPTVARVVPLNQGDNYFGIPIIGTTPDYFDGRGQGELLVRGRMFTKSFEAVVGAAVAARFRVTLGKELVGSHGWAEGGEAHAENPYTVVGILQPTGTCLDRAIFTDYHSVWDVHAHHDHDAADGSHAEGKAGHDSAPGAGEQAGHDEQIDEHAAGHDEHESELAGHADEDADEHAHHHLAAGEVTVLLVQLTQAGRRYQFAEGVNEHYAALAVVPVDEVSKLSMTFLAPLQRVLLVVAYLVVLVSALSILISLYLTIHQRRRDVAVLRSLGATRGDVFRLITLEAAALAGLGVLLGWLGGHSLVAALAPVSLEKFGIAPNAWQMLPVEPIIAASVWALGILAGLLPAVIAYRMRVAETLVTE